MLACLLVCIFKTMFACLLVYCQWGWIRLQTTTVSLWPNSRQLPQLGWTRGHTSYPFPTSKHPSISPTLQNIPPYSIQVRLLHSPRNTSQAGQLSFQPGAQFGVFVIRGIWRCAPRGGWLGYGLGPHPISKAAHSSRTPLAGSKRKIG